MGTNRTIGVAVLAGILGVGAAGGCDIVVGIGTYCVEGRDPGCGGTPTSGTGGSGATGGEGTSTETGGAASSGGTGGAPACTPVGKTQACYGGLPSTEGAGICKGGMQTCQSDSTWGPCEGEVLPGIETCASDVDEDCNHTECALWSDLFGDASNQAVLDVAVDPSGNILVFGFFLGTLSGLQPALTSAGMGDLFLLKLKPTGEVIWSKQWGDPADQSSGRMAVDGNGNVILAGSYQGTLDFENGFVLTPQGGDDIYVAKLSSDGTTVWAKSFGDSLSQSAKDVAVDKLGDILIVGGFAGSVNFGDGSVSSLGANDAFVAKIGGNGGLLWKRIIGGAMTQQVDNVTVNSNGDVLFSGTYTGAFSFASMTLSKAGEHFVAESSGAGADKWAKSFPVTSLDVAAAPDGTWWLAGNAMASVDFGGGSLPSAGSYDIVAAKLDSNGAYVHAKRFGGGGNDTANSLTVDSTGALLLTGTTDSGVDFGGGPLISAGSFDLLLAKFDTDLNFSWARRFGDEQDQGFGHLATDIDNFIYLGCKISGTVDFGAGALVSNGNDVVIAKLAP